MSHLIVYMSVTGRLEYAIYNRNIYIYITVYIKVFNIDSIPLHIRWPHRLDKRRQRYHRTERVYNK